MSFGLPRDLYSSEASDALSEASMSGARSFANMANTALQAKADWEQAKSYAQAYQSARDDAMKAQRSAQKRRSTGGIFGALGTVASFIPGVGSIAGPALQGIGSLFG